MLRSKIEFHLIIFVVALRLQLLLLLPQIVVACSAAPLVLDSFSRY
jgi:hypothetical protein